MTEGAQFPNILLGARGTTASGALNVNDAGITWKKDGVRAAFPIINMPHEAAFCACLRYCRILCALMALAIAQLSFASGGDELPTSTAPFKHEDIRAFGYIGVDYLYSDRRNCSQ